MNKKIEILKEKIMQAKSIVIAGHKNPDGDSVCSALSLMRIIKLNFGKKSTVIYDGNIPKVLDNLPLRDEMTFYQHIPEDTKFDLCILVDYGARSHIGGTERFVNNADFIIEFDHHFNDDVVGDLCFDDTEKAAAVQIIYDVVRSAKFEMDSDIINLITLGLITDTGHFKYVRNSDVFKDATSLVEAGADIPYITNLLNNRDKKTVLMESRVVSEADFVYNGRLVIATINNNDYKKLDGRGDLVLSVLAQIHGVEYVVLLKEHKENQIGISFRSKTQPINEIAESFGGGGHLFAAGAVVMDSLDNVHKLIKKAFKGI